MFFRVLMLFREARQRGDAPAQSFAETLRNLGTVLWPPKFLIFLLIFTGYWIVFWQQYNSLPGYLHSYIKADADVELILVTDGAVVICFTLLVNFLTRKIPAFQAVILCTVISSLAWLIVAFWPKVWGAVFSLMFVALGGITQAPRYYRTIATRAAAQQQGTYMRFAVV